MLEGKEYWNIIIKKSVPSNQVTYKRLQKPSFGKELGNGYLNDHIVMSTQSCRIKKYPEQL